MGGAGVFAPQRSFSARVKERGKFFWNDQKSGTNFFRMTKMGFLVEFLQFHVISRRDEQIRLHPKSGTKNFSKCKFWARIQQRRVQDEIK